MMSMERRIDWSRLVPFTILAASVSALGVAYGAQYRFGIEPCILCLYQRVPYAVAGILAVLVMMLPQGQKQVWAVTAAGVVFLIGAGIAFYHVGVEQHWWASAACAAADGGAVEPKTVDELRALLRTKPAKACDETDWVLFGVTMATYNVFASLGLAVASLWGADRMRRTP